MECQECHKRPATVRFTQVINGTKKEVHICEVCAKEKGYITHSDDAYSLHDLLAGLFNFDSSPFKKQESTFHDVDEMECPKCKTTFAEFKRIGKFGCATCYETFAPRLDSIFRRVHSGNTKHDGKIPRRKGGDLHVKKQIEVYKLQMQDLIEKEAFEEAAKIRDKIKELKAAYMDKKDGDQS